MADVFVSYATEDRERVAPLVAELEANGYSVWWDRRIGLGASFDREIERELDAAFCVVVLWSRHSVESDWVRNEAEAGKERNILVPARIDDVRLPLSFTRVQTAELIGWPRRRGNLVALLDAIASSLGRELSGEPAVETGPPKQRTVAVMDLRDLSEEHDLGWFCDGVSEQLRRQMNGWANVNVLPGAFVRGVAVTDLGGEVDLVVDGFAQQEFDQISLDLNLIDLKQRVTIWNESFSEPSINLYELQRSIGVKIARFFNETIEQTDAPSNPEAYAAYLRIVAGSSYAGVDDEIYWLEEALRIDPAWENGWARLAFAKGRLAFFTRNEAGIKACQSAMAEAKRLAKRRSVWWTNDVLIKTLITGDLEEAERMAALSVQAGFGSLYGLLMVASGLYTEADDLLTRECSRRPYDALMWEALTMARANLWQVNRAEEAAVRLDQLWRSEALFRAYPFRWIYAQRGNTTEITHIIQKYRSVVSNLKPDSADRHVMQRTIRQWEFENEVLTGDLDRAANLALSIGSEGHLGLAGLMLTRLGHQEADGYLMRAAANPAFERFHWFNSLIGLTDDQRKSPSLVKLGDALGFSDAWRHELAKRAQVALANTGVAVDPKRYEARGIG